MRDDDERFVDRLTECAEGMPKKHDIVEIQATAEEKPFSEAYFKEMLALAKRGVSELILLQKSALEI